MNKSLQIRAFSMQNQLPVLYSFRRCPYAIRARLALAYAGVRVELREVSLKNKPRQLLEISTKGTVPVLQLMDGGVIDESLDIMRWALAQQDPDDWLAAGDEAESLVAVNDGEFKHYLDRYKYADRYPEFSVDYYRGKAESLLAVLEERLMHSGNLAGKHASWVDAAIFPFIRQFAGVDEAWFHANPYHELKKWLLLWSESDLFASVMGKYPVWTPESRQTILS